MSNVSVSNCYNSLNGGAYSVIRSSLILSNSNIYGNSGMKGGAVMCDDCALSIASTTFNNNEGN